MKLYLVVRTNTIDGGSGEVSIGGIFDTEEAARKEIADIALTEGKYLRWNNEDKTVGEINRWDWFKISEKELNRSPHAAHQKRANQSG